MTRRHGASVAALVCLALAVAMVGVVWRQSDGVALDAEIQRVQDAHAAARAEHRRLEEELRRLESRARITRFARDSLGMRLPHDHEVVMLPVDGARMPAEAGW